MRVPKKSKLYRLCRAFHYMMWDELAKTGSADKNALAFWKEYEILDSEVFEIAQEKACFACQACNNECEECPIDWGFCSEATKLCLSEGSLYRRWVQSASVEERKILARIIRDLPWNHNDNEEE